MLIIAFIAEQISYATTGELIATGILLPIFLFDIYAMVKNLEE
jgi:hypothetical protein